MKSDMIQFFLTNTFIRKRFIFMSEFMSNYLGANNVWPLKIKMAFQKPLCSAKSMACQTALLS